jgi:hypothetical protein
MLGANWEQNTIFVCALVWPCLMGPRGVVVAGSRGKARVVVGRVWVGGGEPALL